MTQTRVHCQTFVQLEVTSKNPQVIQLFEVFFFAHANRSEIYHVDYSGNKYSIDIDGLLAGGGGSQRGRQGCYFSSLHPFETKYKGPAENSDTPQLVLHVHTNSLSRLKLRVRP